LKRRPFISDSGAKAPRFRLRNLPAFLRELPPRSIAGLATAVPSLIPSGEFFRILNGPAGDQQHSGFGLQFSTVAHIPFVDEVPSAWNFGRMDTNRASFVMWDKAGSDSLFSLWKDGTFPACCILRTVTFNNSVVLSPKQGCACTATLLAATWTPLPLFAIRSARKGP
jgi:hypothetical protein